MYFVRNCDLYLRLSSEPKTRVYEEEEDETNEDQPKTVIEVIKEKGLKWEQQIINLLKDHGKPCYFKFGIDGKAISIPAQESLKFLSNPANKGHYLYQPKFTPRPSFYEMLKIKLEEFNITCNFANYEPDFLHVKDVINENGKITIKISVIEAKASASIKLYHRIQVTLYVMLLKREFANFIGDNNVTLEILHEAGLWLPYMKEPFYFDVSDYIPAISAFMGLNGENSKLVEILSKKKEEVFWHLCSSCEGCEYLEFCTDRANKNHDVSLIPYISKMDKKLLLTLQR